MKKISIDGMVPAEYRVPGKFLFSPKCPEFNKEDVDWAIHILELHPTREELITESCSSRQNHKTICRQQIFKVDDCDWTWIKPILFYEITEEEYVLFKLSDGKICPT